MLEVALKYIIAVITSLTLNYYLDEARKERFEIGPYPLLNNLTYLQLRVQL